MTAVVTPPGFDIFYESPPFARTPAVNTRPAPVINLLPGIVEGRFGPYVTVEMWTNNFGPIWYEPIYLFAQDDGSGAPLKDPDGNEVRVQPPVFSVAPPDRFYTPFWAVEKIVVPADQVARLRAHPVKSVGDALSLQFRMIHGPKVTCPLVPPDVLVDPGLLSPMQLPGWARVIMQAEYGSAAFAMPAPTIQGPGWFEGRSVFYLSFGTDDFVPLPGALVQPSPMFLWVDTRADGSTEPAQLPVVMGHVPLFSSQVPQNPGGHPNWARLWEVYQVPRPMVRFAVAGQATSIRAPPFYPQLGDPTDPSTVDVFEGIRTNRQAPTPSPAVSAIPNVARYAGRVALTPDCFSDTPEALAALKIPSGSSIAASWANTCSFLDSQASIERNFAPDRISDTNWQILAPLMIWQEPQP